MNYQRHYDLLIQRAQVRPRPEGYTERHHILPKCCGGDDSKENLVRLTAPEHYVAHQLLARMHPDVSKLIFALSRMTHKSDGQIRNNKMYGWIKKKVSVAMSQQSKGNKHSFGIRFKKSEEERTAMRSRMLGNKFGLGVKRPSESIRMLGNKFALGNRFKQSEEARAKAALSQIGNKKSLGCKRSEETLIKMREAQQKRRNAEREQHVVS